MEQKKEKLVEIGGAWNKTSKANGEPYVSLKFNRGITQGASAILFINKYKDSEKHPDYKIMCGESLAVGEDKFKKKSLDGRWETT